MTGPDALSATGLPWGPACDTRRSRASLRESFDWMANPATVTVAAGYTKNGEPATLPLPSDLALDLHAYVASLPPGRPIFPLARLGAKMLRPDLERAESPTLTLAAWCSTSTPCVAKWRLWPMPPE